MLSVGPEGKVRRGGGGIGQRPWAQSGLGLFSHHPLTWGSLGQPLGKQHHIEARDGEAEEGDREFNCVTFPTQASAFCDFTLDTPIPMP